MVTLLIIWTIFAFLMMFVMIGLLSSVLFWLALLFPRHDEKATMRWMEKQYGKKYSRFKDLKPEIIEIISHDHLKLKGYYHSADGASNKVVIIHHGYIANRYISYQFYDLFKEDNFNILIVEMRSHGDSEGKYATYGYEEKKDLGLWVEYMKQRIGDDILIGLHGHSMGAATVLLYAGENGKDIKFLVASSAYSSMIQQFENQFKRFFIPNPIIMNLLARKIRKKCGFSLEEVSPIDAIKDSQIPTLFVHGTKDGLISHEMSMRMYEAKRGGKNRLLLMDGAGHLDVMAANPTKYVEEVKKFIHEVI